MKLEDLKAYEIIEKRKVDDLNSEGYLLKHKKTGARVFLLSNDDDKKKTKYFQLASVRRLMTAQDFRIYWSIPYCVVLKSFLQRTHSWNW